MMRRGEPAGAFFLATCFFLGRLAGNGFGLSGVVGFGGVVAAAAAGRIVAPSAMITLRREIISFSPLQLGPATRRCQ